MTELSENALLLDLVADVTVLRAVLTALIDAADPACRRGCTMPLPPSLRSLERSHRRALPSR
jgi:hypothetical protein